MFKMGDTVKQLKQKHWLELVQECNRSGQNKRSWCQENGISYSTYMRWQKDLRLQLAESMQDPHAIVPICADFADEHVTTPSSEQICIQIDSLVITFPLTVQPEYLVAVIRSLV